MQSKSLPNKSLKDRLILLLKFSFVGGLLYFLAKKGFISLEATRDAFNNWDKLVPAVLLMLLNSVLGVTRWRWLLEAQGIRLQWLKVFQLTYIGNFFNIALPGAVSGDFVKAYYIGKEAQEHKSRAFGSILFDRVAGLSALVMVSAGAILLGFQEFRGTPMIHAIRFLVGLAAGSVILFYSYLFLMKEKHDPLLKAFHTLGAKFPKFKSVSHLYESLRHYHNHRGTVLKVLLLSILIHSAVGCSALFLAEAFGETQLQLRPILVVVPLGLLVTAVPVAPAGVGTGNIAFLYFFQLIGSQRGADIFSFLALSNIMVGAFGGVLYSRFKSQGIAVAA